MRSRHRRLKLVKPDGSVAYLVGDRQVVAVGSLADHDALMAKVRDMLQLRLRHAATPARVARVASMFDEALRALGAADDVGTTLVVENRYLIATVRTRTDAGAEAVGAIVQIASAPTSTPTRAGRGEVAKALAKYAHDEARYQPALWLPRRKAPLVEIDETFAALMDALATAPAIGTHKAHGTTYVYSKILRVGRIDERHAYRVRIAVEGRPHDLSIGDLAVGPFFDAAKRDSVVRLKLQAEWTQTPGQPPVLSRADIVGMDDASPATGARILALAKEYNVITADELPEVLASIESCGGVSDSVHGRHAGVVLRACYRTGARRDDEAPPA